MAFRIEKLRRDHPVEGFRCGEEPLDRFLVRYALVAQQADASQTYLALDTAGEVVGFHTLVVGEVAHAEAPERVTKGLARHPIPIMVLARLAVSASHQGQGLGAGLLKDALLRTLEAADIAGLRAFAVHAKNERARAFYAHFNFEPSPTDPLHLYLLIKDIRTLLRPR